MRLRIWISLLLASPLLCLAATPNNSDPASKNLVLTLPQAVAYALRNNSAIQSAYLEREVSTFALEIAKAGYRVQPTLGISPISTALPNAFSRPKDRQFGVTPGLAWNTPYSTDFAFSWANTWNNGQHQDVETLGITQPLLKGFGKTIAEIPLKNAEYADLLAEDNLRNSVISTITQVINDFYNLQGTQMSLDAARVTQQTNELQFTQDKIRVQAGELAPAELTQDKSQLGSAAVAVGNAQIALRNARLALLTDLSLEPDINLQIKINTTLPKSEPDVKRSETIALQNNFAYQSALLAVKQAKLSLLQAEDSARWQLDLTATSTRTSPDPSTSFSQALPLQNQLGNNANSLLGSSQTDNAIGLTLNVPLGIQNLNNQASIASSKLGLRSAELALEQQRITVLNEVDAQIANLKLALDTVHLAQTALAEQADTVHITQQQVNYGVATNFELFQQRINYQQAQQGLISDQINYLTNVAAFDAFLGTTLNTWNIKLKDIPHADL
jgi:outer membrane protein TolC